MIDRYAIAGTPEYCKRRVTEFVKAGVTQVVLGAPFGPDPREALRLVGSKIIPDL
jgi:alkanesulfonate monooxygenase SsuD/methylene tetrahydromethanopterin reductase-like flavin-dependent oxidoreductase (luciferase family)